MVRVSEHSFRKYPKPGVSQEQFLRDRQFSAIVRDETHERPMHDLSRELNTGFAPDERIDHLLEKLWRKPC